MDMHMNNSTPDALKQTLYTKIVCYQIMAYGFTLPVEMAPSPSLLRNTI